MRKNWPYLHIIASVCSYGGTYHYAGQMWVLGFYARFWHVHMPRHDYYASWRQGCLPFRWWILAQLLQPNKRILWLHVMMYIKTGAPRRFELTSSRALEFVTPSLCHCRTSVLLWLLSIVVCPTGVSTLDLDTAAATIWQCSVSEHNSHL